MFPSETVAAAAIACQYKHNRKGPIQTYPNFSTTPWTIICTRLHMCIFNNFLSLFFSYEVLQCNCCMSRPQVLPHIWEVPRHPSWQKSASFDLKLFVKVQKYTFKDTSYITHTTEEQKLVKMFLTLLDFTNRFTDLTFPVSVLSGEDDTAPKIITIHTCILKGQPQMIEVNGQS